MRELKGAIDLIKAGKKGPARRLLLQILRADPHHEKAWQYMILCAANRKQLETSIRRVLHLNPENPAALKAARRFNVSLWDDDLEEPTLPAQRTEVFRPDAVTQAMEQIDDVLIEPVPQRPQRRPPEPQSEVELEEPVRNLRRFWVAAILALFVVAAVIVASFVNGYREDTNQAYSQTARVRGATATHISSTNSAIYATQEAHATSYWASETAYYQTTTLPVTVNFANE